MGVGGLLRGYQAWTQLPLDFLSSPGGRDGEVVILFVVPVYVKLYCQALGPTIVLKY